MLNAASRINAIQVKSFQVESFKTINYDHLEVRERPLYKWAATLNTKQLNFLLVDLPVLIYNWYVGSFNKKQKSENLQLAAPGDYKHSLDQLAVALVHLKPLYAPRKHQQLYRRTHLDLDLTGQSGEVVMKNKNQLKPLTSWSTDPHVMVMNRMDGRGVDVELSCAVPYRNILADTISLLSFMCELQVEFEEYHNLLKQRLGRKAADEFKFEHIKLIVQKLTLFEYRENEVMVYLNKGDKLRCTWTRQKGERKLEKKLEKYLK